MRGSHEYPAVTNIKTLRYTFRGYSHGRGDMTDPNLGKSQGTRAYPWVPVLG